MSKVKHGDWLQKIGLMAGACLIGVILGELALRLAGVSYPVFDVYDETLGAKLMPGKEGWYRKEGEAYLEINSLGYRDGEHELEASAGTFRIAVLGDSFTEARQMPIEQTYWHRLGEALSTCPAIDGRDIEVLNFGIGGYSTTQAILSYDHDARQFGPDLVLLGFFPGNDVRENSKTLNKSKASWLAYKPFHELVDGELTLIDPEPLPAWKDLLYKGVQHSRLLELLNEARRQWQVRRKRADNEARIKAVEAGISVDVYFPFDSPKMTDDLADAWALTERLMVELDRKVRQDGAQFMVASIPTSVQTHPNMDYRSALIEKLGIDDLLFPERQLEAFGEKGGYPAFPLVKDMQTAVGERHFHGFENSGFGVGHMNPDGHEAMARLLTDRVCDALSEEPADPPKDGLAAG